MEEGRSKGSTRGVTETVVFNNRLIVLRIVVI